MGKIESYASCVNNIGDILSQRLFIQCHYDDTLPDLSNVLQNNRGRFYRNLQYSLQASLQHASVNTRISQEFL